MEALVAARNILSGNIDTMDYEGVPSAVFTLPPLASVGLTESDAEKNGMAFDVKSGDASRWPSSLRIGQAHAFYKVLTDPESRRILGAHLLGHNASEMINIFAMAMKFNVKADDLKSVLWAYPTSLSDIKYMV
jgi:glutathione reductase (NADPH)